MEYLVFFIFSLHFLFDAGLLVFCSEKNFIHHKQELHGRCLMTYLQILYFFHTKEKIEEWCKEFGLILKEIVYFVRQGRCAIAALLEKRQ